MADKVELNFLARKNDEIFAGMKSYRGDMMMLTTMMSRVEGIMSSLLVELRARHFLDWVDERPVPAAGRVQP